MIGYADVSYPSDPHKPDLKKDMCSHVEVRRSLGVHRNRHLLSLLLIMLKS